MQRQAHPGRDSQVTPENTFSMTLPAVITTLD